MLTKTIGLSFSWVGIVLGSALVLAAGCGGTGENSGGERCTPNQQVSCACKDGTQSIQVCAADGSAFELCQCSDGGGGAGGTTGSGGTTGTTQTGLCGNGIPDPGECDPGGEFVCPQDCMGTGGAGGTTSTITDTCEGVVTYAGLIPSVASQWGSHPQANGKTGYEAGIEICKTIGADHPCTYEEMRKAEMATELKDIPQGTTTWIHRTTPEMVNGAMSQPGGGGRCNDWIYSTNHISDGEYSTFDQVGTPTYHLDNDTFFDGVDTTHTIANDLQCGGQMRAILCCFPACVP